MAKPGNQQLTKRRSVRYWRQSSQPRSGWLIGCLYLILLAAVFGYGGLIIAPEIEADTRSSVIESLNQAGFDGMSVSVDGQDVSVSGRADSSRQALIEAVAASARCQVLGHDLRCPQRIALVLTETMAAGSVSAQPVTTGKPEPLPVQTAEVAHHFVFHKTADGLQLNGTVPSQEIAQEIVSQAAALSPSIDNRLHVTHADSEEDYRSAAHHALSVVGLLQDGGAIWDHDRLSVWGGVFERQVADVRKQFNLQEPTHRLGDLRIVVLDDPARCRQEFNALLSGSSIRFKPGRAEIEADSQALLERLAALARTCPMDLAVEGHTDNIGAENINIDLSFTRAEAVIKALRDLGVDVSRMTAFGYGSMKPVADNYTSAGRARNRRIEIRVDDQ